MATPQVILRGIVCSAIEARKNSDEYAINGFEVEETYLPDGELPNIPPQGKVWVECLSGMDSRLTRSAQFERDIPIRVSLQLHLRDGAPSELTKQIDNVDQFVEELRDTARTATSDDDRFTWLRTEGMRDRANPDGQMFNFAVIRESNMLLAQFTSTYKSILR